MGSKGYFDSDIRQEVLSHIPEFLTRQAPVDWRSSPNTWIGAQAIRKAGSVARKERQRGLQMRGGSTNWSMHSLDELVDSDDTITYHDILPGEASEQDWLEAAETAAAMMLEQDPANVPDARVRSKSREYQREYKRKWEARRAAALAAGVPMKRAKYRKALQEA